MIVKIFVLFEITVLVSCQESKIVGGDFVGNGELPFMVSIQKSSSHWCGGTIIRLDVVLTAAHCVAKKPTGRSEKFTVFKPSQFLILAGTPALTDKCEFVKKEKYQERKVSEIIVHESFDPNVLTFDVGVLKLNTPFQRTIEVQLIKLADSSLLKGKTPMEYFSGNCIMAGWGRTKPSPSSSYTVCLRRANLTLSPIVLCNKLLQDEHLRTMQDNELCTFSPRKRFCLLDTGGPLVCEKRQVGLAVLGPECANKSNIAPEIWARIDSYEKWFEPLLNDKNAGKTEQDIATGRVFIWLFYIQIIYFIWKLD